jgi:hypothetical protein
LWVISVTDVILAQTIKAWLLRRHWV